MSRTAHDNRTDDIGTREHASLLRREIAAAEGWMARNANRMTCGEQDAAGDQIAAMRAELADYATQTSN